MILHDALVWVFNPILGYDVTSVIGLTFSDKKSNCQLILLSLRFRSYFASCAYIDLRHCKRENKTVLMTSVDSRTGLFPKKGYLPTGTDENKSNGDIELQVKTPPTKPKPSYENMEDRTFTDDPMANHQYEEPVDIRNRNGERPIPGSSTTGHNRSRPKRSPKGENDFIDGYHRNVLPNIFKTVIFASFFLALAAFLLVVFVMVGVITTPECYGCQENVATRQDPSDSTFVAKPVEERLREEIKKLKSNFSKLDAKVNRRDESISKLLRDDFKLAAKIAELERKASYRVFVFNDTTFNISSFLGPQIGIKGENGLDGMTGKTGPGNMTLCRYISEESAPFTPAPSGNGQNVIVTEPMGKRIIGVTCSTRGASEYNLKSVVNAVNMRQYECECRGKSSVFSVGAGYGVCIIHYWICESFY